MVELYKKYIINKDDEKLYDQLKDAIYSLSLDIKSAKVCNQISPVEAEEMKEYYWGYCYDRFYKLQRANY